MPNPKLKHDVADEIDFDPGLDTSDLHVHAHSDGRVSLTGSVPTYAQSIRATDAALRVSDVLSVENDLTVNLGGATIDDDDLAGRATNALEWWDIRPANIAVSAHDGVLTMSGTVTWNYQREDAYSAVRGLYGVRGVNNNITLEPSVQTVIITSRISDAMARHARLDADKVSVAVTGDTITLTGEVRSYTERDDAGAAAWMAPGVHHVNNRLMVSTT